MSRYSEGPKFLDKPLLKTDFIDDYSLDVMVFAATECHRNLDDEHTAYFSISDNNRKSNDWA